MSGPLIACLEEFQNLGPPQLASDCDLPRGNDAVGLEDALGEIQTDGGNLHGGRLLLEVASTTTILWRSDAGHRGRPPHQSDCDRRACLGSRCGQELGADGSSPVWWNAREQPGGEIPSADPAAATKATRSGRRQVC